MKISEILNPDKQKALKGSDEKKKAEKNSLAEIAKTLNKTLPELHKELQMMEELRGKTLEQMEETLGRKAERRVTQSGTSKRGTDWKRESKARLMSSWQK